MNAFWKSIWPHCFELQRRAPPGGLKQPQSHLTLFFQEKGERFRDFSLINFRQKNQLTSVYCKVRIYLLPKFYANWGQDHYLPVLTVFIIGLPFLSHRLYLAPKYIHQRKVWKPGISLNSEMNEVFTLYCTAIWQL